MVLALCMGAYVWLRLLNTFYSFQCGVNFVQNYFDYYSLCVVRGTGREIKIESEIVFNTKW